MDYLTQFDDNIMLSAECQTKLGLLFGDVISGFKCVCGGEISSGGVKVPARLSFIIKMQKGIDY